MLLPHFSFFKYQKHKFKQTIPDEQIATGIKVIYVWIQLDWQIGDCQYFIHSG